MSSVYSLGERVTCTQQTELLSSFGNTSSYDSIVIYVKNLERVMSRQRTAETAAQDSSQL